MDPGHTFANKETIYIIEQSLPDQLEEPLAGWGLNPTLPEGLPDACIYTENGWTLVIESKVAARVSINQLNRHINTLKSRGFTDTSGHRKWLIKELKCYLTGAEGEVRFA